MWWGSSLAAVSALVGVGVVTLDRGVEEEALSNEPAQIVPDQKQVRLAPRTRSEALRVAAQWIDTAVARKNVAGSWALTDPALRGGYTRSTWAKGDIPVVPYPVASAKWRFDYAYEDRVGFKVALFPKRGSDLEAVVFDIDLKAAGSGPKRRWLVDEWAPTPSRTLDTRVSSRKVAQRRAAAAVAAAEAPERGRLGARWLLLPVSIILGIALVLLGSLGVTGTVRSRRARRAWREHRQSVSES
jgi:hypothetical protein